MTLYKASMCHKLVKARPFIAVAFVRRPKSIKLMPLVFPSDLCGVPRAIIR